MAGRSGNTGPRKRSKVGTRRPKKRNRMKLFTSNNLSFAMTTLLTLFIMGLMTLVWFMHDLPDISTLTQVTTKTPSIVIRTRDGDIIGSSGDIYGEYVRYNDIPRDLIKAVIATEDRNFFKHHGIDPFGLLRAMLANFRSGRIVQGGSTITQQLAKNVFLTPERSLKRKVQEVILALSMERRYSKQEIITVYLNRVYFGAGTYGIDAAARRYFNKPAKNLMLPESALIAGLLKAPSRYAPTSNENLAVGRATQVLINMEDAGLLTEKQRKAAAQMYKGLSFPDFAGGGNSRYFTDWILEQLPDYIGDIKTDLIVTTPFNPKAQQKAESALTKIMDANGKSKNASQAALVSMTPDGGILAMAGGREYGESQYNRATQARRQPGSSFKLFVYLAALEAGWRSHHMIDDTPINIKGWMPGNYSGRYEGVMTLRQAFEQSVNTVAVRLSESTGRQKVIEMAHRLGLKAKMSNVPSIALGVTESTLMEMTAAYAHVASGGLEVMPYGIVTIQDTYGKIYYKRKSGDRRQVLSPATVRQMNDMLLAVVESGTGRGANIGRPVAGKTGTSQDFRDAWFIGFTPELVTGVWVGNDNNAPMRKITGGNLPAQIWAGYMQPVLSGTPIGAIPREGYMPAAMESPSLETEGVLTVPGQQPQPVPMPQQQGGELGQGFWDKLFDGELKRDEGVSNDPRERDGRIRR